MLSDRLHELFHLLPSISEGTHELLFKLLLSNNTSRKTLASSFCLTARSRIPENIIEQACIHTL